MTHTDFMQTAVHLINSNEPRGLEALSENSGDYGVVYNFSPIRANIVSWCDISGNILEIGGELGAVTVELLKKGSVTSVEKNREYAAMLRKRCPESKVVSSVKEAGSGFDFIVIIGTFEDYADGAEADFLRGLSDALSENGKIILAADNSAAVGRLSGRAAETYTKNGYSRSELCAITEASGLKRSSFLYPSPDYRFTNVIFSDERLPDSESIKRRLLYAPSLPVASFSENSYIRKLLEHESEAYPTLADAFLLVLSKKGAPKVPSLVCFSVYRKAEYMITTVLDGEKALKHAANESARPHLEGIGKNIKRITENGISMLDSYENHTVSSRICHGETVGEAMLKAYKSGGIDALSAIGDEFFAEVEKACDKGENTNTIFDRFGVKLSDEQREKLHFLKYGYMDMIFQNCFVEDGKNLFYDQEWMFENTPLEYIIFRAITNSETLCLSVSENLFDVFGISEYKELFEKLNAAFSHEVYSGLYKRWYANPLKTPSELLSEKDEKLKTVSSELSDTQTELYEANAKIETLSANLEAAEKKSLRKKLKDFLKRHPRLHGAVRTLFAPYNKCKRNMHRIYSQANAANAYALWMDANCPTEAELNAQRRCSFEHAPVFSILTPLFNTDRRMLTEMIDSVRAQTYPNWELCLSDASDDAHSYVGKIAEQAAKDDGRIKYQRLTENLGIAKNTSAAASLATGEYIALLDHDDLLAPDALFEMAREINRSPKTDFIYTDEDKFTDNPKKRSDPNFKPDFSIYTLRSFNYICHFTAMKKSLFDAIGGYREGYDGAQDYDLFLRAAEKAEKVSHVAKPLYHWRVHTGSTAASAGSKNYAADAGRLAVESHLKRVGIDGKAVFTDMPFRYRVKYPLTKKPLVSVIIPNKDSAGDLRKCIDSVFAADYKNVEIIVVENNSTTEKIRALYEKLSENEKIRVVKYEESGFNYSKINNYGALFAKGELILLLNNDIEAITPDWLSEMVSVCLQKGVCAVGARLLYPDDTVQHSGVIVGLGGVAGHIEKFLPDGDCGYFGYGRCIREMSAVTAACMLVRHDAFSAVGGFDEGLAVAFNDIDLCMKLKERGDSIVYTPYARLHHFESKSRGLEDNPEKIKRFNSEIARFNLKWEKFLEKGDPFFNKNLSLKSNIYLSRTEKVD